VIEIAKRVDIVNAEVEGKVIKAGSVDPMLMLGIVFSESLFVVIHMPAHPNGRNGGDASGMRLNILEG